MAGKKKLSPIEAFELNMADAHQFVKLVDGFTNQRRKCMRTELRERVGTALRVHPSKKSQLGCLESDDVFGTFLPGSSLSRDDLPDPDTLIDEIVEEPTAAAAEVAAAAPPADDEE